MGAFDANRVLTAILMIGAFVVGTRLLAEVLYAVPTLERPAYMVEGAEVVSITQTDASPAIEDIHPLMATADVEAGKSLARKCLQCHGFEEGGKNKVGPNLWHSLGQKIGGSPGYAYSKAFKALEGNWTVEKLNKFLAKPKDFAPGTKMTFIGIKKAQDRANLIAYINSMSPAPKKF